MIAPEPRTQEYTDMLLEICNEYMPTEHECGWIGAECNLDDNDACQDVSNWTWASDGTPVTFNKLELRDTNRSGVYNPTQAPLNSRVSKMGNDETYWTVLSQGVAFGALSWCAMGDHWSSPPLQTATCVGGVEQ